MKKIFALMLIVVLVLSMTGVAFAGSKGKSGNRTNVKVKIPVNVALVGQKAEISNKAEAKTGDAYASGNVSYTYISSKSKADSNRRGDADSKSEINVTNYGEATAYSGDATAKNEGDNKISVEVKQENK